MQSYSKATTVLYLSVANEKYRCAIVCSLRSPRLPSPSPGWVGVSLSPRLFRLKVPHWSTLQIACPVFVLFFSVSLLQWLNVLWGTISFYLLQAFHHLIISLFLYHRTGIGNGFLVFSSMFFWSFIISYTFLISLFSFQEKKKKIPVFSCT